MDRRAADEDLALRRAIDAGQHVDQRGLAAARFADDGHELAAIDLQIDAVQRGELARRGLVDLVDIVQFDQRSVVVQFAVGV